ncbi:hypothetical protein Csp2054_12270 [Curtobacterium sp. 'Ferrero']|nr:hypothetical protein Csp2054_12270 [Curtobacterium sp. 'Ferrero']
MRSFTEAVRRPTSADLQLEVVVPLSGAASGLVRALLAVPWVTPQSTDWESLLRAADAGSLSASALERSVTTELGVGFVARYVAASANNFDWSPVVSSTGIVPLEGIKTW